MYKKLEKGGLEGGGKGKGGEDKEGKEGKIKRETGGKEMKR